VVGEITIYDLMIPTLLRDLNLEGALLLNLFCGVKTEENISLTNNMLIA